MSGQHKCLILGSKGQLGCELLRGRPDNVAVRAHDRDTLDITDAAAVAATVNEWLPDTIINAAAHTAVDRAESEPEAAFAINETGAANIAAAAARTSARMIHVSTDFVFAGTNATPRRPNDETGPLSVYGASKLAGERAVFGALGDSATIVRTAWVYAVQGSNFVQTMLRLMASRPELRVVCDQVGTPTHARSLARTLWAMQQAGSSGTYHWTDRGVASWYDFAVAIQEEALLLGLLENEIPIEPIPASEYPTPAKRPAFSVLDCSATSEIPGVVGRHWRTELREMLTELAG